MGALPTYVAGNEGDSIQIITPDDLTGATVKEMRFRKPNGVIVDVEASFTDGTGANGELRVVTDAAFKFDEPGRWRVRAYVEIPAGKFASLHGEFQVERDLPEPEV
jgi:hypothetical protein